MFFLWCHKISAIEISVCSKKQSAQLLEGSEPHLNLKRNIYGAFRSNQVCLPPVNMAARNRGRVYCICTKNNSHKTESQRLESFVTVC